MFIITFGLYYAVNIPNVFDFTNDPTGYFFRIGFVEFHFQPGEVIQMLIELLPFLILSGKKDKLINEEDKLYKTLHEIIENKESSIAW